MKLSYDKWVELIKSHLSKYKTNLGITEDGTYRGNKYSHILPVIDGYRNYLDESYNNVISDTQKHSYWYHLNSSQSMCVNFFEYIKGKECLINYLLKLITGYENLTINECSYEKILDPKEYTNFDFYIKTSNDLNIYFEIKYTENGFAKECSKGKELDDEIRFKILKKRFDKVYKNLCENSLNLTNVNWKVFMTEKYQLFRNVVRANSNSYVVFLTMRDNLSTYNDLKSVEGMKNICTLYWESLINELQEKDTDPKYFDKFKQKYFLTDN